MRSRYLIFFVSLIFLSFCSPQNPSTARVSNDNAVDGAYATGTNATANSKSSSASSLYEKNTLSTETGVGTSVRLATSGAVGSTSCSIHTNRQPGDICAYDFCGTAASNSFLSPAVYKTVLALVAALKAQGKFPTGTCTDAAVITALESLQTLDLSGQGLTDISPLEMMTSLTTLNIQNNQISDLSYLSNMKKLTILYANSNKLVYLTGLSTDISLTQIYVANNQITSVDALATLPNLTTLDISNNEVVSIVPLTTHQKIGIAITGNPGIITSAPTAPKPTTTTCGHDCFSTLGSGGNIGSDFSCIWGSANLSVNAVIGNKPISTQSAPTSSQTCTTE